MHRFYVLLVIAMAVTNNYRKTTKSSASDWGALLLGMFDAYL